MAYVICCIKLFTVYICSKNTLVLILLFNSKILARSNHCSVTIKDQFAAIVAKVEKSYSLILSAIILAMSFLLQGMLYANMVRLQGCVHSTH